MDYGRQLAEALTAGKKKMEEGLTMRRYFVEVPGIKDSMKDFRKVRVGTR